MRGLTRREFLKAAGAGAAGMALLGAAGCDAVTGRPPGDPPGGGSVKNVVLVIIDSLRKDHLGAYGNGWIKTPNLDALAKESLRFTWAYPEATPTICARRAIHTGARSWPFRDWWVPKGENAVLQGWQPIPRDQVTLAEVLAESGYQTSMVTDNLHQFKPSYNMHRGFGAYDFIRGQTTDNYKPMWSLPQEVLDGVLNPDGYFPQYLANVAGRRGEEDFFAPMVFGRASEYLGFAAEDDRPFFMTVDCYDPHAPYDPPDEYAGLYSDGFEGPEPMEPVYGPADAFTDAQLERMRALYAGEVTMVDRWLGRFLDRMEELDLFEDTMLILLSDHGVAHGEHGVVGKGPAALWPEVTDVPFMIRHPKGKMAGRTSDFFASTHDVAQTVLGSLGLEAPERMAGQLDGRDLSVFFGGGEPEARDHFTLGYHDHTWARDERYAMFAKNDRSGAKLYDLEDDPGMDRDVAAANPGVVEKMWNDYVLGDAGGPLPRY
jgi:arylsulfatase A-like enzyme